MALSSSKLKDELSNMGLYSAEADAIQAFATAFNAYFAQAASNGAPIAAGALVAAKAAMVTALAGMGASGAGAAKIQAAIAAYWGAILPAVAWPTVTAITPPVGLSGISAALSAAFTANKNGKKSKADSMEAIANAIHGTQSGGIAAWPPPPAGVGPQPIL